MPSVAIPASWATIEDALQAWVVAGSGLASDHVVWAQQSAPRPVGQYISMQLTILEADGTGDWIDDDLTGGVYTAYVRGPRKAALDLTCFAGAPTGGAPTGVTRPGAVLSAVSASFGLPSQNQALSAAGIGVAGFDSIRSIGDIVNTVRFEPRATTTVHLHLASELAEVSTYVQTVNATNQIPTPPTTVTVTTP